MVFAIAAVLASANAQQSASEKPAIQPIDPASIDLTQPTLFIVPYTHLDEMWRWSYPQTIRDFLRNTLDDNFAAFEEYPLSPRKTPSDWDRAPGRPEDPEDPLLRMLRSVCAEHAR